MKVVCIVYETPKVCLQDTQLTYCLISASARIQQDKEKQVWESCVELLLMDKSTVPYLKIP